MNRLFTLLLTSLLFASTLNAQDLRIDPPFWWEGMAYNTLELVVHGEGISMLSPKVDNENIKLVETTRTDNPNYLFVNIEIMPKATDKFDILFVDKKGKAKKTYTYELKKRREGSRERASFNSSDVIYLLMPDRFSNGNPNNDSHPEMIEKLDRELSLGRHGGDIRGIINHVDYIADMGYTALWPNPVLENNMPKESYHGYAITDFYKADARLGTNADYLELSKKCHENGLKLIQDMVFNHFGTNNYLIKDLPSKDWVNNNDEFVRSNFRGLTISHEYAADVDRAKMNDGWFDHTMADMNQRNPHVLKYLIQNSIWWVEYADLDGIRMDTYPYPDKEAMRDWALAMRAEYPNLKILGESWLQIPYHTAYWQKDAFTHDGYNSEIESVTDFPTNTAFNRAINENDGWTEGLNRLYYNFSQDGLYANPNDLVIFPDNHDIERFTRVVDGDMKKFKTGIVYYLTVRGTPQIYYGTEIMMDSKPYQDHGSWRRDYPGGWEGDDVNAFTGQGLTTEQKKAQDFMKKMLNWRKESEVIHTGKFKQFLPENNVYVYCRYTDKEAVLIIINKNTEAFELDLSRFKECTQGYNSATDVIGGKKIDTFDIVTLEPEMPMVLELKK